MNVPTSDSAALTDRIPHAPREAAHHAERDAYRPPPATDAAAPSQAPGRMQFGYQLLMLFGALAVLGVAALLRLDSSGSVEMPVGSGQLPSLCVWRQTLGINCPGCGLTRAFVSLAHGQCVAAWRFNAAGPFFFALVLYQVPFRAVQLVRLKRGRKEYAHSPLVIGLLAWGAVAALIVQWAWRLM